MPQALLTFAPLGSSSSLTHEAKNKVLKNQSFILGAAEDTLLEPFDSISDWLLSSPDIKWTAQLKEASGAMFVQQYHL